MTIDQVKDRLKEMDFELLNSEVEHVAELYNMNTDSESLIDLAFLDYCIDTVLGV